MIGIWANQAHKPHTENDIAALWACWADGVKSLAQHRNIPRWYCRIAKMRVGPEHIATAA